LTLLGKFLEESTFIFGDTRIPFQHNVKQADGSLYAKNELDPSSHFNTTGV